MEPLRIRTANQESGKPRKKNNLVRTTAFTGALLAGSIFGCATQEMVRTETTPVVQAESREKGSKLNPYSITPLKGRKITGIGGREVQAPLGVNFEGTSVHFRINLTLSQLRQENIEATTLELDETMKRVVREHFEQGGYPVPGKVKIEVGEGLRTIREKISAIDEESAAYLSEGYELKRRPAPKMEH